MTEPLQPPVRRAGHERLWLLVLGAGAVVWLVAAVVTGVTKDTILVPTVILVGSFFVPLAMVVFAVTRDRDGALTIEVLGAGFLAGGTIGLLGAALTEVELLPSAYGTLLGVGLIEEGAKGLVLVAVASRVARLGGRDGMVLGATVGAGFASFESAGYAMTALIDHGRDHPIKNIVATEATRALLAPFGHITWTALLGGALFAAAAAGGGRLRLTGTVALTFAGVVVLHAAWDATYAWAITISEGLVGTGWHVAWPNTKRWAGSPTGDDLVVWQVAYDVLIAINAAIGTTWIVRRWRAYRRSAPATL
jgi:RsiW-degrading membrane proteinase PrsW (M82 family)